MQHPTMPQALRPRNWQAKWIWPANARHPATHVLFRRDFTTDRGTTTKLFLSVETFARVYLNDIDLFRTSSLSYPGVQHYEEVDLTPYLNEGVNRLAIVAWYAGVGCTSTWLKDPGLLAEIEVARGDEIERIGTDESWPALKLDAWTGRLRSRMFNLDLSEEVDYRQLSEDFPCVRDLSTFDQPESLPWAGVRMGPVEPRPFPRPELAGDVPLLLERAGIVVDQSHAHAVPSLAISHEPPVRSINFRDIVEPPSSNEAVTLVFHLGGYEKGYPHIVLDNAPAGAIVDLSWCEALNAEGHFDARPNQPWVTDRYTLRDGHNVISPEEWKCGRFIQLTFRNVTRPIRVKELRFIRERYPLNRRVQFRSSDEQLNRIVEIGLKAAELCMHDRIMDCPWRERRQWIGDVQRIALINYYAFDDQQLIRGVLRQQARLQDPTGRMWVCMPLMEEFPAQSMEWVRAILEYELYTGDATLREELADNVEWLHRWFMKCRDDAGLFFNPHRPVFNWMDNPLSKLKVHQFDTAFLASNLRYLLFLDDVFEILVRANRQEAANEARRRRDELAGRIPELFLDTETGLLRECADPALPFHASELSAALAVRATLPAFNAAGYWDRYQAFARTGDPSAIPCSPFGKYETYKTLGHLGRPGHVIDDIRTHWGPMVAAGSDTAWEWFEFRGSQCHGWSGIPIVALLRHVLHVDPRVPGVTRRTNVHGIDWMECEVGPRGGKPV